MATLPLYGGWALSGELGIGAYSALVFQRLLWPLDAADADLYQRAMAS